VALIIRVMRRWPPHHKGEEEVALIIRVRRRWPPHHKGDEEVAPSS
jgi:hypothetical protein